MKIKYIFLILCIPFIIYGEKKGENKSYFEIYGAYDQITMSDYNKDIQLLNDMYNYYGIDTKLNRMEAAILIEVSYIYNLESLNSGRWGIYFTGGRLNAGNEGKLFYDSGQVFEKMTSDYSVLYGGFGLRKYIANFYLGANACIYFNTNNSEKDEYYLSNGTLFYSVDKKWSTAVYGYDFEAGTDMWLTDNIGIAFRGGYRYAVGTIDVNWGPAYDNMVTEEKVDYSGLYIGAGFMFGFDMNNSEK